MSTSLSPTRRSFLKAGAAGVVATGLPSPIWPQEPVPPLDQYQPAFLSGPEWAFVVAATARLIPSQGDGPGAIEARVPVFIDLDLAGPFGGAADWYMAGPHVPGADPDFGYQTPLTPAEIYRAGIVRFDAWCAAEHGEPFAALSPDLQDAALEALEADADRAAGEQPDADAPRIMPDELRDFFALLIQNTKEGYFSDPKYGGNHQMRSWVYIGFPGARANFLEWVDKDNIPYPLGPVSISGERA